MCDKNGLMGRSDLKQCPRQCTVWPNAKKFQETEWKIFEKMFTRI